MFSDFAEETLEAQNQSYRYFVQEKYLGRLAIRNQKPGSHVEWEQRQKKVYLFKPVHILDTEEKEQFFLGRLL